MTNTVPGQPTKVKQEPIENLQTMFFYLEDAIKFGTDEAVVLANIRHWVLINITNHSHYYDDHHWVYYSLTELEKLYRQYTKKQVRRIIDNLINKGALLVGNYNKKAYDFTRWFALADEQEFYNLYKFGHNKPDKEETMPEWERPVPKRARPCAQKGTTIPNTIQTDKKQREGKSRALARQEVKHKICLNKKAPIYSAKAERCVSKNIYSKEIEEIIGYLNTSIGKKFRPDTKKYQMLIIARIKEGYTVDDFKAVIDLKAEEWLGDFRLQSYLRPSTLFSTKFDEYLNNVPTITRDQYIDEKIKDIPREIEDTKAPPREMPW